ncbi:hypothetical protein Nepgr_024368 [Nepenthes gracilis]|uniref:Cytochrome b5 heme-binding domain-containing protein n=1 Tax=Nepenthes gracilis TaxID=150966 RepID=A0AAD3T455_NEPGR|nr:hypothetical protein Nepgr_024368 [Nepenthes gracilis]
MAGKPALPWFWLASLAQPPQPTASPPLPPPSPPIPPFSQAFRLVVAQSQPPKEASSLPPAADIPSSSTPPVTTSLPEAATAITISSPDTNILPPSNTTKSPIPPTSPVSSESNYSDSDLHKVAAMQMNACMNSNVQGRDDRESCLIGEQARNMSSESKVFVFEEVAKHSNQHDCWLIISGKVYNVTSFLDDHPGGDDVLLSSTNRDATEEFEDVGHSDDAKQIMKKYYIGEVDMSTVPAKKKYNPVPMPSRGVTETSQGSSLVVKLLQFLVPLLVLAFAFSLKFFKKD